LSIDDFLFCFFCSRHATSGGICLSISDDHSNEFLCLLLSIEQHVIHGPILFRLRPDKL
jgi:hypothetical protein